jgi:ABC-type antimicrobial peptide transport system permease subunit
MALGADARRLSRMVLRQGAIVGGGGLAVGLASAAALSRVLESFLFGVTSREPSIFIGTAAVLLAVSLLAALTPARRAASVDLVASLRHEN